MPTYRAFEVDDGGHVSTPATIIEAKADVQAITKAMLFANGWKCGTKRAGSGQLKNVGRILSKPAQPLTSHSSRHRADREV
jgi:hypothetical protein